MEIKFQDFYGQFITAHDRTGSGNLRIVVKTYKNLNDLGPVTAHGNGKAEEVSLNGISDKTAPLVTNEALELLELMEDECLDLTAENHPIADTGDVDGVWYVHRRWSGPKDREQIATGETALEALRAARAALGQEAGS